MPRARIIALLLVCAGTSLTALAAPPTEDQVKAALDAYKQVRKDNPNDRAKIIEGCKEALKDLSISEATATQINSLGAPIFFAEKTGEAAARMKTLSADKGPEGAIAAVGVLQFMDSDTAPAAEQVAAIRAVVTHPGLRAALLDGKAVEVFGQVGGASEEALKMSLKDLPALENVLTPDMPATVAVNTTYLYSALIKLGDDAKALRDSMRPKMEAMVQAALAKAEPGKEGRLKDTVAFYNSPFAKGTLMNNAAPALTVKWSSDPAIKTLADLKGKVVVLDYWATWCGPCIASFPNVRELVAHYEGYPVAVVGVTSIQGRHHPKEGAPIDCKGDPDKEMAFMPGLMKDREMTWPVIFTEQSVFNPDYGVMGIPHVAILDPDGKVRYNGLHPGQALPEKYEKINGLLKEFKLSAPENK